MNKPTGLLLGLLFLFEGIGILAAQEKSESTQPPPKVIVLYREFLKPGRAGATHEKSESAFVQAVTKAKWPTHYFAVDAVSGRPRSLFLFGYDSYDAWEKDYLAGQKNSMLAATLNRAAVADGDLLSDMDSSVLDYREDQSLHPNVDIAHMRYFEVSLYQVRPGHGKDWDDLVKLVQAAYEKIPDSHWATYEVAFGQQPNTTYVVFIPLKSASEIDHESAQDKDFVAAMGEGGMKRLNELETAAIESRQSNLFAFNPKMSYPPDAWVKADPDFWKPKAKAPAAAPKATPEKPAVQQ
jgi:hypothetical protein